MLLADDSLVQTSKQSPFGVDQRLAIMDLGESCEEATSSMTNSGEDIDYLLLCALEKAFNVRFVGTVCAHEVAHTVHRTMNNFR